MNKSESITFRLVEGTKDVLIGFSKRANMSLTEYLISCAMKIGRERNLGEDLTDSQKQIIVFDEILRVKKANDYNYKAILKIGFTVANIEKHVHSMIQANIPQSYIIKAVQGQLDWFEQYGEEWQIKKLKDIITYVKDNKQYKYSVDLEQHKCHLYGSDYVERR